MSIIGILIGRILCTNCGKLITDPKVIDVNKDNNVNKKTIIVCDNCGKLIKVNE